VVAFYEIEGACHSCNPAALVRSAGLHAKNRRAVTVIDSDVAGGSHAGLVVMIEVVALMIGEVVQCYSDERYNDPRPVTPGLWLRRGAPKSLFRPGSSTVILLFEPGRLVFDPDLVRNLNRTDVRSRFSAGLGRPLVETEVWVRSSLGLARPSLRTDAPRRGARWSAPAAWADDETAEKPAPEPRPLLEILPVLP
jgi:phosphatidylserine decarboxylase